MFSRHRRRLSLTLLSTRFFLGVLFLLVAGPRIALAKVENRTIDDQTGDQATGALPVYAPKDKWAYGPDCNGCFVRADAGRAHGQSWHDATVSAGDVRNITLTFTGTALYIFCIIPNFVPYATTIVNLTFAMDGRPVGRYFHSPSSDPTYDYNVPVYTAASLANTEHTFVLTPTGGTNDSLVLFDYAIYTYDDTPTSSSAEATASSTSSTSTMTSASSTSDTTNKKSTPVGAIAGGVGGGVGALLLGLLILFLCLRKRRKQDHRELGEKPEVLDAEDVVDPAYQPQPYVVAVPTVPTPSNEMGAAAGPMSTTYSPSVAAFHNPYGAIGSDIPTSSHQMLLPPGGLGTASVAPSSEAGASVVVSSTRSPKSAMRQAMLEQQLQEMQRRMDALPSDSRTSVSGGGPSVYTPSSAGGSSGVEESMMLRAQVEALRVEVERLRAENASGAFEAPPAYVDERDDLRDPPAAATSQYMLQEKRERLVALGITPEDIDTGRT